MSAWDKVRSFAESRAGDEEVVRNGLTYGDLRELMNCAFGPPTSTTYRWRSLVRDQREYITDLLRRRRRRLMRWAEQATARGEKPEPFGGHARRAAMLHASRAGAVGVLLEMLSEVGGHE